MKRAHLEISFDRHGTGTVKLDGEELRNVVGVSLRLDAGEVTRAEIELLAVNGKVDIADAPVDVRTIDPMISTPEDPS